MRLSSSGPEFGRQCRPPTLPNMGRALLRQRPESSPLVGVEDGQCQDAPRSHLNLDLSPNPPSHFGPCHRNRCCSSIFPVFRKSRAERSENCSIWVTACFLSPPTAFPPLTASCPT